MRLLVQSMGISLIALACTSVWITSVWSFAQEYLSGIVWPEPPVIQPGDASTAPSDAIVLFNGKDLDSWVHGERWQVQQGVAIASGGSIHTKQGFGDCQIHLEFATPEKVDGSGQGRGNSGVYIMGRYEVQILDSFQNETYFDGQCGAIYKQQPPMVNASRAPGEWQSFDIFFTAPKFHADGSLKRPAYLTAVHNGVLIHHHVELSGGTSWSEPPRYSSHSEKEPLHLQFHGNPVRFRNIWIRENVQSLEGKK
jgi:hypothetical protein